ncbi:hypothetical protein [Hymenobacter sp. B81]|uniref:hypothetical protein n=1 Tax=Hymenobacter sp. B81 TaxID=3344878 RepID=UPI0037DC34BC
MIILERLADDANEVYAVLSYEPALNYLLMKWIGYCSEDKVKAGSLRMLDWQRREGLARGCRVHVHHTKEMEGAWAGLVEWIHGEFFPRCYEAGLRYNISVLSPDLFTKLSSEALFQRPNALVPTLLCETLPQAERWLSEKYRELNGGR